MTAVSNRIPGTADHRFEKVMATYNSTVMVDMENTYFFEADFLRYKPIKSRPMKKAGIVIILIGALLTIFTTITYFTREKVVDLGDLEINANKRHNLTWSPLVGIAVMAVGAVIAFVPFKK